MPHMDSRNAERLINTYADTILRISYMYLRQTHDAEDICLMEGSKANWIFLMLRDSLKKRSKS